MAYPKRLPVSALDTIIFSTNGVVMTQTGQVSAFDRALGLATRMIKRFLFHLLVLICCAVFLRSDFKFAFFAYVGIVCIFPRSFNFSQKFFSFPAVTSIIQFIVYALFYNFWPVGLLWAGLQTWVLRAFIRRFDMDLDWLLFPFVLIAVVLAFNMHAVPYLLFPVCTVVGYFSYQLAMVTEHKKRIDTGLRNTLAYSEKALNLGTFPADFCKELSLFQGQCVDFLRIGEIKKHKLFVVLMPAISAVEPELCMALGWAEEQFKTPQANNLLASIASLNYVLDDAMKVGKTTSDAKSIDPGKTTVEDARFTPFYVSARQLLEKKTKLPQEMQADVQAIYISTMNILRCMSADTFDLGGGKRFLDRYLPAAHTILDDYIRLKGDANHKNVADVLEKTADLLKRMVDAFHEEHGNLLRNDTMEFDANLNVLDKLLKMDGK